MKRKFTAEDLDQVVNELSIMRYFPGNASARAVIASLLAQMCPHLEALRWVVDTFVNQIGEWHGPKELRAILCRKYLPADGIEAYSAIPGFTTLEAEAQAIEESERHKQGSFDNSEFLGLADRIKPKGFLQ